MDKDQNLYLVGQPSGLPTVFSHSATESLRWTNRFTNISSRAFCPPSVTPDGSLLALGMDNGRVTVLRTKALLATNETRVKWYFQIPTNSGLPLHPADRHQRPDAGRLCRGGKRFPLRPAPGRGHRTGRERHQPLESQDHRQPAHEQSSRLPSVSRPDLDAVAGAADGRRRHQRGGVLHLAGRVTWLPLGGPGAGSSQGSLELRSLLGITNLFVEANLALGPDGLLYVATRQFEEPGPDPESTLDDVRRQLVVALNLRNATNPFVWMRDIVSDDPEPDAGILTGCLVDRMGGVFVANYGHRVVRLNAVNSAIITQWGWRQGANNDVVRGKLCATPALTESGLLLVPQSDPRPASARFFTLANVSAYRICDINVPPSPGGWLWEWFLPEEIEKLSLPLNFVGAMVVRDDGRIYAADTQGNLWRLNGESRLHIGGWPTLQANPAANGNRKPVEYLFEELPAGYAGDSSLNSVRFVTPAGRVLGRSTQYSGYLQYYAALWNFGTLTLNTGSSGQNAMVMGGNRSGWWAGYQEMSGPATPRLWANGFNTSVALPKPSSWGATYASKINDAGQVIGYGAYAGQTRPVRWDPDGNGNWTTVPIAVDNAGNGYAYGISESGRIYGKAQFQGTNSTYYAFVTDNEPDGIDPSHNLGAGTGGLSGESEAWDRSELGGTVGTVTHQGLKRAFRLPPNEFTLLADDLLGNLTGVPPNSDSEAYAVNCDAVVVGRAKNSSGQWRAFIYSPSVTQLQDLNVKLPPNCGWVLTSAVSINDNGLVCGYGTRYGQPRAWVYRPKP
jgi:hypothetical protein